MIYNRRESVCFAVARGGLHPTSLRYHDVVRSSGLLLRASLSIDSSVEKKGYDLIRGLKIGAPDIYAFTLYYKHQTFSSLPCKDAFTQMKSCRQHGQISFPNNSSSLGCLVN